MCETHLGGLEEIKVTTAQLQQTPIQVYQVCFADWKSHWHPRVGAEGDYFEGNDVLSNEE